MAKSCKCSKHKVNGVSLQDDRLVVDVGLGDLIIGTVLATGGFIGANYTTKEINNMLVQNGNQALDGNVTGFTKIGLGGLTGFLGFRYGRDNGTALPAMAAGLGMCVSGKLDLVRANTSEETQQTLGLKGINAYLLPRGNAIPQQGVTVQREEQLSAA